MTFSYNLVLALFLLAPGFAFVAGVYATGRSAIHEASPPPPNSIMALARVTGGSLVAHTFAAILFMLGHALSSWTRFQDEADLKAEEDDRPASDPLLGDGTD